MRSSQIFAIACQLLALALSPVHCNICNNYHMCSALSWVSFASFSFLQQVADCSSNYLPLCLNPFDWIPGLACCPCVSVPVNCEPADWCSFQPLFCMTPALPLRGPDDSVGAQSSSGPICLTCFTHPYSVCGSSCGRTINKLLTNHLRVGVPLA